MVDINKRNITGVYFLYTKTKNGENDTDVGLYQQRSGKMVIRNNIAAMSAYRHYQNNLALMNRAALRLSTGYRINSAADDPAGLAISEKMRAQIRGLNMAARNVQDAISLVQTAEGYMQTVCGIMNRMTELAVRAASDTCSTLDRNALAMEFEQLKEEINDIARQAYYNDMPLMANPNAVTASSVGISTKIHDKIVGTILQKQTDITIHPARLVSGDTITLRRAYGEGSVTEYSYMFRSGDTLADIAAGLGLPSSAFSLNGNGLTVDGAVQAALGPSAARKAANSNSFIIQTGANQGDELELSIPVITTGTLGLDGVDIFTRESASAAISSVGDARKIALNARAYLGALHNRLEFKYSNLKNQAINLTAAESRIRDADIAQEMTNFIKYSIQTQVSMMVMAHMNAYQRNILWLMGVSLGYPPPRSPLG